MKNLVRGGVALSIVGMFVMSIYPQTKTAAALNIATDSQRQLNNTKEEFKAQAVVQEQQENKKADKKLVDKTVISRAAGISKGMFVATAYCLKGKTAMGHRVRQGLIAADPRVLGLGSSINIGAGSYSGTYLVSDTGGGIKGRRLDIWMANCSEARRFGRRNVSVLLLPK